ncbi:uncharacterized protein LOC121382854 [Gigantopelta aegis]|uniref:uncharacterized protein LOC121382854 n=1 Tax=Gigantopelta aegis TaxID=1735272 RepID=UPI001B889232|nr:uncharacterized protein LOC121382854 [Gigantopelta aegis]
MESSKPKRKPNWTEDETLSLVRLVDERKDIIRGKFGAGVTSKKKKEAWLAVTEEINAAFPSVLRTSEDCEKRWYNVQCRSRKEISTQKTLMQGTGGGPVMNLSGIAEAVYDVLGHSNVSISGVDGGLDSSLIQVFDLGTRSRHVKGHNCKHNRMNTYIAVSFSLMPATFVVASLI